MSRAFAIPVLAVAIASCACAKQPSVVPSDGIAKLAVPTHQRSLAPAVNARTSAQTAAVRAPGPTLQPQAATTPGLISADVRQGAFQIGGQTFTFVKHVQTLAGSNSSEDSTVEWWELRDATGKVAYHVNYGIAFQNGTFEETEDVVSRELKTKFGQGMMVEGMSLPSAPNSGSWVQIFGLVNGKLVPFDSPIATEGEFLGEDVDTFQPSPMLRGQPNQPVSRDVLNFRVWTGNFDIVYAVAIDWIQGTVRPAWTCTRMTSKGPGSACRYKVQVNPRPRSEMIFVRLFPEAEPGGNAKHLVIKPGSKIEFLEAEASVAWSADQNNTGFTVSDPEKAWLHIKVDGEDGWISGEEDFEAVGLPQAE